MKAGSFWWCQAIEQGAENDDAQEVPPEHEGELYCGGDQSLKQVAQSGCGVFFTEGIPVDTILFHVL